MFYWIIATILESLDTILWKKSLDLNKMPQFMFNSIWYTGDFIMAFILILFWVFNYELIFNYQILSIIFAIVILTIFNSILEQYIYKSEKISVLVPYEYLSSIFVIIISFFLFSDVSIITLIITLLAIIIITLFSIDFKKLVLPKNIKLIFLLHIIWSIKLLTLWYILIKITNFDYFSIFTFFFSIITLIVFIIKKYYKQFNKWNKEFYKYRFSASIAWTFWELMSLFIIAELWLILATLLWFLWLASTLILWYFILKDKPSKKDILLAVIILILISIWYYFK